MYYYEKNKRIKSKKLILLIYNILSTYYILYIKMNDQDFDKLSNGVKVLLYANDDSNTNMILLIMTLMMIINLIIVNFYIKFIIKLIYDVILIKIYYYEIYY